MKVVEEEVVEEEALKEVSGCSIYVSFSCFLQLNLSLILQRCQAAWIIPGRHITVDESHVRGVVQFQTYVGTADLSYQKWTDL